MNAKEAVRQESLEHLRNLLKPGDTVSTILRHVSRSGMQRRISAVIARDGEVIDITWHAARAMGESVKQRGAYVQDAGIVMVGCGMDMGFALVYNLSYALYPNGFTCPGESCPSNDHSNDRSEAMRRENFAGHKHTGDGGYALKHKWL